MLTCGFACGGGPGWQHRGLVRVRMFYLMFVRLTGAL